MVRLVSTTCSEYACGDPEGWLTRKRGAPFVKAIAVLVQPRNALPAGALSLSRSRVKSVLRSVSITVEPSVDGAVPPGAPQAPPHVVENWKNASSESASFLRLRQWFAVRKYGMAVPASVSAIKPPEHV